MRDAHGLKLIVFGLQLTLIGTQVDEWFVLVFVGVIVSLIGFVVDRIASVSESVTI